MTTGSASGVTTTVLAERVLMFGAKTGVFSNPPLVAMTWPGEEAVITSLATGQPVRGKIEKIELLGHAGALKFTQDANGLKVKFPAEKPCDFIYTLKITGLMLK